MKVVLTRFVFAGSHSDQSHHKTKHWHVCAHHQNVEVTVHHCEFQDGNKS